MSETELNEREFIIPLRRYWFPARTYERTSKAIKAIKQFIAKHMKLKDRNINNVKLDVYFNNEVWYRGRATPPSKIKVKAIREGEIVKVTFAETPSHIQFIKAKHERRHKKLDVKPAKETEVKQDAQAKAEEKSQEQKVDEKEKEKATAIAREAEIKQEIKAEKHSNKPQKASRPQRMALKK